MAKTRFSWNEKVQLYSRVYLRSKLRWWFWRRRSWVPSSVQRTAWKEGSCAPWCSDHSLIHPARKTRLWWTCFWTNLKTWTLDFFFSFFFCVCVWVIQFCKTTEYLGGIMHDWLGIVINSEVNSGQFVELTDVGADVFVQNSDVIVPVGSLLLMPQSQGVADLVHRNSKLKLNKKWHFENSWQNISVCLSWNLTFDNFLDVTHSPSVSPFRHVEKVIKCQISR